MAGLNCQNFHQNVNLGPNLNPERRLPSPARNQLYQPATMGPTAATHDAYAREFTPLVELRLEGRYQITRAISFHAGWTGFWMDNIARANSVIDYTVPAMGIDLTRQQTERLHQRRDNRLRRQPLVCGARSRRRQTAAGVASGPTMRWQLHCHPRHSWVRQYNCHTNDGPVSLLDQ